MKPGTNRRNLLRLTGAVAAAGALPWAAKAEDAPPAKPISPMPGVEVYAASPLIDQIALSPDGSRVAMVSQNGDNKVLAHFHVADPEAATIGLGPSKIRNLIWGDNQHVVLTNSITMALEGFAGDKHEFSQARAINVDTGEMKLLFANEEEFYAIVMGGVRRIKVDGEYRVTAQNFHMKPGYELCLYSFSLDKARSHLINQATTDTEGWVVTPDGFPLAYTEFEDTKKEWRLYYNIGKPGNTRFKQIYRVTDAPAYPSVEGIGRDGAALVIYIPRHGDDDGDGNGFGGDYYEISAEGVLGEPIDQSDDQRERSALFHPVTWRLAGFSRHDDWFTYDYFDPLLKKLAAALAPVMGDEYRVSIIDFAEDPRRMILYGESPQDAGSYYYSDFSTGDLRLLATNYADLPQEWITQKQPVAYKAADGLDIHGYLTLPPFRTAKNLPLVVLPHGGPWARDYVDFDWQAQVFASRGYAVLQPNFRGSTGYGDAFENAGEGEIGRKMQTDLSDGVRWLAAQGTIDAKRVAIFGASYGGYAALAGATLDPGVYTCAVSVAGLSDFSPWIDYLTTNYITAKAPQVQGWVRMAGDKSDYDAVSPARQAAKASCPILMIHGTDDTVVPIDQSRRMEKALKAAGKDVQLVTYKGQDHWETVGSSRIEMMKVALDFLTKHNPPDSLPA